MFVYSTVYLVLFIYVRNRVSVVSVVTRQLDGRFGGSNSGRCTRFMSSPKTPGPAVVSTRSTTHRVPGK